MEKYYIITAYILGIITQYIINYLKDKKQNIENKKALLSLKNDIENELKELEVATFDGVITLITGEKIEGEFFHRLSDDTLIDKKNNMEIIRSKVVCINYTRDGYREVAKRYSQDKSQRQDSGNVFKKNIDKYLKSK